MKERTLREYYQVNDQYIPDLYFLQVELLKLQKHIHEHRLRMAILFEGRDTAGKGTAIGRFSQFLNPRHFRTVALGKPTEAERGQWYFQRYIRELPDPGQLMFFDRSWYNRAVVEPVMGFCTPEQYALFMHQVNDLERMLIEDGLLLVKFWFSIDALAQRERIERRRSSPLKQWKVSPVDLAAQEKFDEFTRYKELMFEHTHTRHSPWIIIKAEVREEGRINAMRHVLSLVEYDGKSPELRGPDAEIVFPYRR